MKISAQRLRNLTTRKLHTLMVHIYKDLEAITGTTGLMTHMLPRVIDAVDPWLKEKVVDKAYWDGLYNPNHLGEIELPEPTAEERKEMLQRYKTLP